VSQYKLFTIGCTQKTAETFFTTLKNADVKKVIDVRLNNTSQLSGFAKKDDLIYFLRELYSIEYLHEPLLSPTKDLLDGYKKKIISWSEYKTQFLRILKNRRVQQLFNRKELAMSCLLCSENKADRCHRRLVAEYLKQYHGDIEIHHL